MKKSAVVAKATSADFSMIRFYYIIVFITIIPSKNVPVLRLFHRKTQVIVKKDCSIHKLFLCLLGKTPIYTWLINVTE